MKIAILGYSGSGKSTLATWLGRQYGLPVLHMDQVQFLPGWQERPRPEALALTARFMEQENWVIDGNYTQFYQKERLAQADRILILQFGRFSCLWRALRRWMQYRGRSRESMAEGCPEKIDAEFVRWILFDGRTKEVRDHYRAIARQYPEKVTILRDQRQLDQFYQSQAPKGVKQQEAASTGSRKEEDAP